MAITSVTGPLFVSGQPPSTAPITENNPDAGPSVIATGLALSDTRYAYSIAPPPGSVGSYGIYRGGNHVVLDQAPSQLAAANIAAAAHVLAGVAMTKVTTSGAGITVTTTATFVPQSGLTVPAGALAIDVVPTAITFGTNGSIAVWDPRKSIARAVSMTGVGAGGGVSFKISGYDLYGYPQTETLVVAAGVNTVNTKKCYKWIASILPATTDAQNYSVGTADIYEFPLAVYERAFATITWNNALITAATGFVAADATTAALTTGSVRGTYAVQDASDGTKKLQVMVNVAPWNALTPTGTTSLFGVKPG